jgi:hypothetical protein
MTVTVLDEKQLFDRSFWSSPEKWPHDPPGSVFLARAFDEIGRAIHGDQWNEPEYPEEPENDEDENAWEAYERAEEAFERLKFKLAERKVGVARIIAKQCEEEKVVTAARRPQGEMVPLQWHRWNVDDLRTRFFRCEMCLEGERCWLFVTRDSLAQFIATQPYAVSSPLNAPHLSPYLKVMLSVSAAMEISPENQPAKKLVEYELEKKWNGGTLSKKLLGTMATLIREPESQLGRARKKQK